MHELTTAHYCVRSMNAVAEHLSHTCRCHCSGRFGCEHLAPNELCVCIRNATSHVHQLRREMGHDLSQTIRGECSLCTALALFSFRSEKCWPRAIFNRDDGCRTIICMPDTFNRMGKLVASRWESATGEWREWNRKQRTAKTTIALSSCFRADVRSGFTHRNELTALRVE